jgi:hypothetical protein
VINAKKVAKHFVTEITDDGLTWRRDEHKIAAEAALDGIYVIRSSLPADALPAAGTVESYKALENVERVFRGLNTDLLIRPIRHRLAGRVKAHVLIMWNSPAAAPPAYRGSFTFLATRGQASEVGTYGPPSKDLRGLTWANAGS